MQKFAMLALPLLLTGVVTFNQEPVSAVISVYEEQRQEQQEDPNHDGWIHEFETASVGSEMEHLQQIKPASLSADN